MSIDLRKARHEDAPAVAEVLLSSRRTFLPYAPFAHTEPEVRAWVRDALIPSNMVTLACEKDAVVGVLAVERHEDAGWIDQLYVLPDHVGRGIGAQLLGCALAELTRPVRLYTFEANARARSFYERHGFKAVAFGDGSANEEGCPDVLYELAADEGKV